MCYGTGKNVHLNTDRRECENCQGTGICPGCGGTGRGRRTLAYLLRLIFRRL